MTLSIKHIFDCQNSHQTTNNKKIDGMAREKIYRIKGEHQQTQTT